MNMEESKMKKYFVFLMIIIAASLLCFINCDKRKYAWGKQADIRVLADSTMWEEAEPILRDIFEKPLVTPQNETVFTILQADSTTFKKYNNLILIANLNEDGSIARFLKKSLAPELLEKVEAGSYIFVKKDEWALNQFVMILVAKNTETLKQRLTENKKYLFSLFNDHHNKLTKTAMFRIEEQKDVEEALLEKYGWMVRVQYDYVLHIEAPEKNFVMLRRGYPERWLFVHWMDSNDPSIIERAWMIEKRNEIGLQFYGGDQVEEKYAPPKYEEVEFLGRRASKLSGLWQNEETVDGGCFINYSFFDEELQRIFMLDFCMFDPRHKKTKRPILRQGEVILHTFKTAREINGTCP